jgi:hypothetical protein
MCVPLLPSWLATWPESAFCGIRPGGELFCLHPAKVIIHQGNASSSILALIPSIHQDFFFSSVVMIG